MLNHLLQYIQTFMDLQNIPLPNENKLLVNSQMNDERIKELNDSIISELFDEIHSEIKEEIAKSGTTFDEKICSSGIDGLVWSDL